MNAKNFFAELKRRNVYKVAITYAVVAWLLVQAASIFLPAFDAPSWGMKFLIIAIVLGFPIALVLSWAFELTPEGIKREEDVAPNESITHQTGRKLVRITIALAVIAAGLLAFQFLRPKITRTTGAAATSTPLTTFVTSSAVDQKSVAVLAFANLSDEKGNESFADSVSEELLNVLGKVPGLKVTARTSAFHFKGKDTPIPEIAKQLGVAYVVEGSVRKAGDKVRITAQLIKAADGFHVWSDTFPRDLKDIFAVQEEIAGLIAQQLQLKLGMPSRATQVVNPEAHRLVLEGRYFWNLRSEEGFARAETAFKQALVIDPQFAPAHAGLALDYVIRGQYRVLDAISGGPEDWVLGRAEAQKAIGLDPLQAEPYAALAYTLANEGRWKDSGQLFQKTFILNPNYAMAHFWHGLVLGSQGRLDLSLDEHRRAGELDP